MNLSFYANFRFWRAKYIIPIAKEKPISDIEKRCITGWRSDFFFFAKSRIYSAPYPCIVVLLLRAYTWPGLVLSLAYRTWRRKIANNICVPVQKPERTTSDDHPALFCSCIVCEFWAFKRKIVIRDGTVIFLMESIRGVLSNGEVLLISGFAHSTFRFVLVLMVGCFRVATSGCLIGTLRN